ncbi:MAG TPA: exosortase/archaeosortase family protein [Gemmatimonadaceae bacterium]|nr:exosortase/archaeosortase family protein [Gemmatimonadaceae bacterium]
MTGLALPALSPRRLLTDLKGLERQVWVSAALTIIAFIVLFFEPMTTLAGDWWNDPDAGHGLLLAPVALWLAAKAGIHPRARRQVWLGAALLIAAVLLRYASGLASELFTMRASMIGALGALTIYYCGFRQVVHWWLPFTLFVLAVPLPELVTQALALPLQFKASQMGAALLEARHVPVLLSGNIIRIPGHELFVTEACSGLRSLTALASMAILIGALFLRTISGRVALFALAIPIAIVVNGLRVFLTGFLVHFVDPKLGTGFLHATEGWLLFLVSLAGLAGAATVGRLLEGFALRKGVA